MKTIVLLSLLSIIMLMTPITYADYGSGPGLTFPVNPVYPQIQQVPVSMPKLVVAPTSVVIPTLTPSPVQPTVYPTTVAVNPTVGVQPTIPAHMGTIKAPVPTVGQSYAEVPIVQDVYPTSPIMAPYVSTAATQEPLSLVPLEGRTRSLTAPSDINQSPRVGHRDNSGLPMARILPNTGQGTENQIWPPFLLVGMAFAIILITLVYRP